MEAILKSDGCLGAVILSYLPPELYADVFAMGLVDLFGTVSYGATVIIVGVGEVDEQREWRTDVPLASGGEVEAVAVVGWKGEGVEKGAFIDTDAGVVVVGVEI